MLSFAIPFFTMFISFVIYGVHPFGDRQIMISDFWHQYYPFIAELQRKLQAGESLTYSMHGAMGTNFVALASYYLMSPLNLLTVLVPRQFLREAVTVLVLLKLGTAGLSMGLFLKHMVKRKEDISLPIFASMYALSTYAIGFYWNIMWMDTFALAPLVMLGLYRLIKEGRTGLYMLSLFFAVMANYYIGYIVCVFTFIAFFAGCFMAKTGFKGFIKRLFKIAFCSLAALAATAVVTLPAYLALGHTYSAGTSFPTEFKFYEPFTDIIGQFAYVSVPAVLEGLPNIYAGMFSAMLIPAYAFSRRIGTREKVVSVSVLAFLIFSMNFNVLNYIWHAFHFVNMIPYRFSLFAVFIVVIMAYKVYPEVKDFGMGKAAVTLLTGAVFLICAYMGQQERLAVLGGCIMFLLYAALVIFMVKRPQKRGITAYLILLLMFAEIVSNAMITTGNTGTSGYSDYPDRYEDVKELLMYAEKRDDTFSRVEMHDWYTTNDPMLYGYRGVSQFSSMINESVTEIMRKLGISAEERQNRYVYNETSPFTNGLLGIRYLVSRTGELASSQFFKELGQVGDSRLFENLYPLTLGFMSEDDIPEYAMSEDMPFEFQNMLFREMTGVEEDIFDYGEKLEFQCKDTFEWTYTMPEDGTLFAYTDGSLTSNLTISGGEQEYRYNNTYAAIVCAGYYKKGDTVTFEFELRESEEEKKLEIRTAMMNVEAFEKGYSALADEQLEIESMESDRIKGSVNAIGSGDMFISLPYDGGWTAAVDGKPVEVERALSGFCKIELDAGYHEIELRYEPEGLLAGKIISAIAMWTVAVCILRKRK